MEITDRTEWEEIFKNIFSKIYFATFTWKQTNQDDTILKNGSSWRLYRIPFWKNVVDQIDETILEFENSAKIEVTLENIKRV